MMAGSPRFSMMNSNERQQSKLLMTNEKDRT